ncbi:hypothetical protein SeMB42_g07395 [Synchytrium endobioticum]|nr:hypothetical protein SeMB42_g07395 [Synchytrium endobioticum]
MSPALSPLMSPQPSPTSSPIFLIPMPSNVISPRSPMRNSASPAIMSDAASPNTNVYVRGLHPTMTDDMFHDMVKTYGTILSAKAIINLHTGECKGFGFAMYDRESEAAAAMHGLEAQGYQVSFARVGPKLDADNYCIKMSDLQDLASTNLYISNIPLEFNEANLMELLKPQVVLSAKILREINGKSRGVGFARLETRDAAMAVISQFNEKTLPGADLPLQVRFADSEAQKRLRSSQSRTRKMAAPGVPIHGVLPAPSAQSHYTPPYPLYPPNTPLTLGLVTPVSFVPMDLSSTPSLTIIPSPTQLVQAMSHLDVTNVGSVALGDCINEQSFCSSADGIVQGASVGMVSICGETTDGPIGQPLRPADLLAVTAPRGEDRGGKSHKQIRQ